MNICSGTKKILFFLKKYSIDNHFRAKFRYIKYVKKLKIKPFYILLESNQASTIGNNLEYVKYLTSNSEFNNYKIFIVSKKKCYKSFVNIFECFKNVKVIVQYTKKYYKILASARFLFNDESFGLFFIKKEGQIYCNTWHGTPLKTLGKSSKEFFYKIGNTQKNFCLADYIVFPNSHTKKILLKEYMIENISKAKIINCGYPRNDVFCDYHNIQSIKKRYNPTDKKIYCYMPTWRYRSNNVSKKEKKINSILFNKMLIDIDKKLEDNEILYVNTHVLEPHNINYSLFKHIKKFPRNVDTYSFLSISDVLITDYSSVFYDYAYTRKKIVLFMYDLDDYSLNRGLYFKINELPFPVVKDVDNLVSEIRAPKKYDDEKFISKYCRYDDGHCAKKVCDAVILNQGTNKFSIIPKNDKSNVLIYVGNFAMNGISSSFMSLINNIDVTKRNYYFSFTDTNKNLNIQLINKLKDKINYFPVRIYKNNKTVLEKIIFYLVKRKIISFKMYIKLYKNRINYEYQRTFGAAQFDHIIQYNGYDDIINYMFANSVCKNRIVYVHANMTDEIENKHAVNKGILSYLYDSSSKIVVISENLIKPTMQLTKNEKIIVAPNFHNNEEIIRKSQKTLKFDENTVSTYSFKELEKIIKSDNKIILCVGRFSEEKGHKRLIEAFEVASKNNDSILIICGGYSVKKCYSELADLITLKNLNNRVILIKSLSNPYPLFARCAGLILTSYHEGMPVVFYEAATLNKPIVSTDIPAAKLFINSYGGKIVDNSTEGIITGLNLLINDQVNQSHYDCAEDNVESFNKFESIFE